MRVKTKILMLTQIGEEGQEQALYVMQDQLVGWGLPETTYGQSGLNCRVWAGKTYFDVKETPETITELIIAMGNQEG